MNSACIYFIHGQGVSLLLFEADPVVLPTVVCMVDPALVNPISEARPYI